jgi:hypothetical protein
MTYSIFTVIDLRSLVILSPILTAIFWALLVCEAIAADDQW